LVGKACKHSEENCLVFSEKPNAFDGKEAIRAITKEEALEVLVNAGKEGLVHSTYNVQKGVSYICNCCTCACALMRGIAEYGHMDSMGRSDFYVSVDETLCAGCSVCIDRCQFNALEIQDDSGLCGVDLSRCYGCGLCVPVCPTGALSLKHKTPAECEPPSLTESEWREKRFAQNPH